MQFQLEAMMDESNEYRRRQNLLAHDDQERADYLLKRISSIRGGICYAILGGFYYALAFVSLCSVLLVLVGVVISGDCNPIDLIIIGVFIFLALLGLAFYFVRYKPRRLKFQRELAADPRLAKVFKTMGFRSP